MDLAEAKPKRTHLIALCDASDALPLRVAAKKGRVSRRVGFVHYFHREDYQAVCMTLHTPYEIADYLDFRKVFVQRCDKAHTVSEKALLGKYLTDTDASDDIDHEHELVVDRLIDNRDDFNISQLLREYCDRIVDDNNGTQYHAILKELAKLTRNYLREFRNRFEWAMEKCREETQQKPSRFLAVEQQCAFIAIPLPECDAEQTDLQLYTTLCKYDLKAERCLGFSVSVDRVNPEAYRVHWCLLDYDWIREPSIEEVLNEGGWFREVKQLIQGKYTLR